MDFDIWNKVKKETDSSIKIPFFHPREIWFARLGKNIGYEQNGKGNEFLRPIIVVKKFNNSIFWGIPLSTYLKKGRYYFYISDSGGKKAVAILSQIRLIDGRRLRYKIGDIDEEIFSKMKRAISDILLSNDDY